MYKIYYKIDIQKGGQLMDELQIIKNISEDKKLIREFLKIPMSFWSILRNSAKSIDNKTKQKTYIKSIEGDKFKLKLSFCVFYGIDNKSKIFSSISDNIAVGVEFFEIIDYMMYLGKYPYNNQILTEYKNYYKINMYGITKFRNLLMRIFKDEKNLINNYFNQVIIRYLNR